MKLQLWQRAEERRKLKKNKNKIKDSNLEENPTKIFLSLSSDFASVEKNEIKKFHSSVPPVGGVAAPPGRAAVGSPRRQSPSASPLARTRQRLMD